MEKRSATRLFTVRRDGQATTKELSGVNLRLLSGGEDSEVVALIPAAGDGREQMSQVSIIRADRWGD